VLSVVQKRQAAWSLLVREKHQGPQYGALPAQLLKAPCRHELHCVWTVCFVLERPVSRHKGLWDVGCWHSPQVLGSVLSALEIV